MVPLDRRTTFGLDLAFVRAAPGWTAVLAAEGGGEARPARGRAQLARGDRIPIRG